jgi:hypothetical protein
MQFSLNPNSKALESFRPQHDRLDACIIAQQYSSATFFSLPFHSRTKKWLAY